MGAGDLAELLRELKGRSGLSYGALAKRLHVSTSTLHRYVNGTAVPTEFAPVERLARLCKATPDELLEVHRRWIVADATRGRKAEPVAAPQETQEPQQPQEPTEPPESSESSESAPGPAPVSTESPQPQPQPERAPQPETVPEPETELEVAHRHRPGPKSRLSPSLSRGKRQRLGVLAAVGVVLAIGGTALAVHSASGSSGGGDGKHAAVDDAPRPDTERSPSGTAEEQPSGKPSRTSSAKPPEKDEDKQDGGRTKGAPQGGGEGSEGRAPGAGGKASGGRSGRAPLTVSTQPQYWESECGRPYLINRPPNRLPSPPTPQDAAGWVSAFEAVSAGSQDVKFTVQGTGKETVVLESLNIRVVGRSDPPAWNKYLMGFLGVGCGGGVPKHVFNAKLDHGQPALVSKGDDFPYKVSESDPETFYVSATAASRYVRWYLELEWSSGSRHGTVVINDEGKPFRTSAAPDDRLYGYTLEGREWVKAWRRPNGEDGYEWEGM
ncbi:helix-turn-helix domain-containing protein [Streptomyces spectabilis]|uniref:helix-turn-helix domain-containing protein n=1 Tax=Streptomyces spectabilis TaxID=68270 RepID=UPI001CEF669D|nr:helix-turn-helix domain-containing protein [Streptomyces spectabilis]